MTHPTARSIAPLLLAAALAAGAGPTPIGAQSAPPPPPPQTPPAQPQQGQPITGVISAPGLARLSVAVPPFRVSPLTPAPMRDAATEMQLTVISDLDFSGYFDVLAPERYSGMAYEPASIPFRQWAGTGAVALLIGTLTPESARMALEGLLFDTRGEQLILGKRYRGEPDVARQVGHRLSNEIVLHFTGRPGIALSRVAFEGRVGKAKEIFMMDYDGKGLRQVTRNGSLNVAPAISPDGTRLSFVSYKSGVPRLYILSQDGTMADISIPGADLNAAPDWSPDGRRIAFSAARGGNSEIYIHELGGGPARRLTTTPDSETSPCWSPSGREILFTSDRTGKPQIYAMDAEGGNVRRVTLDGTYNDQGSWSPQGERIAYSGWVDDHFDVFVLDAASGAIQKLTGGAGFNENPRWSADGRHIVFSSNRTGIYQLYTMDDNGNRQARVSTPFEAFAPDWSR